MMALLAGLGAGYLGLKEKERTNKREDAQEQRAQEEFDMRKAEYEQKKADREAVRDVGSAKPSEAYTPAQGQELEAIANAKDAQGNPYYTVGSDATGKYTATPNFQDETGAQPKAHSPATIAASGVNYLGKTYDKPLSDAEVTGARRTRMADLAAGGNVAAGVVQEHDQRTVKFDQDQQEKVRKLKEEGIFDAAAALRRGDAAGMTEAFNRSGEHKIIGDVTITPEKRTIPGAGDIDTYTASFQLQGPDGNVQQVTRNSFDLSTAIMPYEKLLDEQRKGKKGAADVEHLGAQTKEAEARANYWNNGGAPGAKAAAGQGGDKPFKMDEDDKIRVKEAAASVRDAEKMVNDAMKAVIPGDDPTKSPAVMHAQGVLRQAKRGQFVAHIQTGVVTPEMLAAKVIGVANTKEDVFKSLKELADDVGAEYADQVAAQLHGNDKWTALSAPPAQPNPKASTAQQPAQAAAPAQIAAQGVQPPRRDFYAEQKAAAERGLLAKQAASKEAEAAAQARAAQAIEQDRAMEEKRKAYLAARGTTPRATPANTYNFPR